MQRKWKLEDYLDFSFRLEKEAGFGSNAYEYLHKLGWARVLDWRNQGGSLNFCTTKELTKKQRNSLFDFCLEHNLDFNEFTED